jgi:hypothetical protein
MKRSRPPFGLNVVLAFSITDSELGVIGNMVEATVIVKQVDIVLNYSIATEAIMQSTGFLIVIPCFRRDL